MMYFRSQCTERPGSVVAWGHWQSYESGEGILSVRPQPCHARPCGPDLGPRSGGSPRTGPGGRQLVANTTMLRCDRPKHPNRALDASVSSDRSAQDRSKAKPDEVVQTPVVRLSGRAASRATKVYAVRAAEMVLTLRVIWKFAD
jgi:hypothetical protein